MRNSRRAKSGGLGAKDFRPPSSLKFLIFGFLSRLAKAFTRRRTEDIISRISQKRNAPLQIPPQPRPPPLFEFEGQVFFWYYKGTII